MINDDSRDSGDDAIAEPFDQTNGLVVGLEGDSDGTADSDLKSASDRGDDDGRNPGDGSAALAVGPRS
ncbi:hypothetical protein ACFFGH_10035 [Lysobacter korlensis]|uniref:Uncharacterized protein n=1 Tax=Lysobacter korlensis TaxID=553636 RepID=A0ABV6RQH6_9GAMM